MIATPGDGRRRFQLWPIALIALSVRSAVAEPADPAAATRARWNDGAHALAKGDLEGARAAFLAAYEALPDPELAQSLGEVEYRTRHYAEAVRHLTVAIDSRQLTREEQRVSKRTLQKASAQVGTLFVAVDVDGADIVVDGQLVGRSPLDPEAWYVEPGQHVVFLHKDDYSDAAQKVAIDAGETARLSFQLTHLLRREVNALDEPNLVATTLAASTQESTAATSGFVALPVGEASSGGRTATLVTGAALTVISTGVGSYLLLRSSAEKNHADELRDQIVPGGCVIPPGGGPPLAGFASCQQLANDYHSVDRDRNLSIASFAAAGVLGVATVATFFLWPGRDSPATVRVAPLAGGAGVVLGGTF